MFAEFHFFIFTSRYRHNLITGSQQWKRIHLGAAGNAAAFVNPLPRGCK